jgi:hypothetical protein
VQTSRVSAFASFQLRNKPNSISAPYPLINISQLSFKESALISMSLQTQHQTYDTCELHPPAYRTAVRHRHVRFPHQDIPPRNPFDTDDPSGEGPPEYRTRPYRQPAVCYGKLIMLAMERRSEKSPHRTSASFIANRSLTIG